VRARRRAADAGSSRPDASPGRGPGALPAPGGGKGPATGTPEELRVLVLWLRALSRLKQTTMAKAIGVNKATLCRYEEGLRQPDAATLARLAQVAAVPSWEVDGVLLPAIRLARAVAGRASTALAGLADPVLRALLAEAPGAAASAGLAEFLAGVDGADPDTDALSAMGHGLNPADQPLAQHDRVGLLSPLPGEELPALDRYRECEGLVERLCEASVEAAPDDPVRALDLARAALWIATAAPCGEAERSRLMGYAWAFVANAQRVAGGDLLAAAASSATAWRLWRAGSAASGSRLAEWRLLELEASLSRDRRCFDEALAQLDAALAAAPAVAKGRILLNQGFTLEQAGRLEEAASALREATLLIGAGADARLRFGARFNRIVLLCHGGRHAEAAEESPALRRVTEEIGNALDLLRVHWLEGRIAAGLGQSEAARDAFEEVRRGFADRQAGYHAALVSIELAILHLEAGRTAAARDLADQMLWIFKAQRVSREALAALRLFCQAAASDALTAEFARQVFAEMERAGTGPSMSTPES
jgi:transcriptional regulator with XRE-family HTH domain/tetratricopeptide (TPR) repeat protein